jgi:hypothetical protein
MEAAGWAEKEFGAQIVIIKMSSPEYAGEKDPPPFPSVIVDDRLIASNDIVTYEGLKSAIIGEKDP